MLRGWWWGMLLSTLKCTKSITNVEQTATSGMWDQRYTNLINDLFWGNSQRIGTKWFSDALFSSKFQQLFIIHHISQTGVLMNDASAIDSSMTGSCNHSAADISSNCHILHLNSLGYVSYLNLWSFNFLHAPGSNILINNSSFFILIIT